MTARTERSEFFLVPEHGRKLGILPSPRVYTEETVRRVIPRQQAVFEGDPAWNFSKFQGLYRGGEIEIFKVPMPIERGKDRNCFKSQSLGGSSEFCYVPGI